MRLKVRVRGKNSDEDLLSDETRADGLCQPSGEAPGVVLDRAERADHLDAAEGAAQLAAPAGHLHLLSEVRLEGLKLGLGLGLGLRYSVTCSARFAWKASRASRRAPGEG